MKFVEFSFNAIKPSISIGWSSYTIEEPRFGTVESSVISNIRAASCEITLHILKLGILVWWNVSGLSSGVNPTRIGVMVSMEMVDLGWCVSVRRIEILKWKCNGLVHSG